VTVDSKHCPRCGAALPARPPTRCTSCGYQLFVNARPTATVIIVRDGEFLAVRRTIEPKRGMWELPGGFCDGWEHPSDAAVREAREELGVTVRLDQFVGMYLGSYEFQDETLPVLDCFWLATIVDGEITLDPGELSAYEWVSIVDPPPLAFATMDLALVDAARIVAGRSLV
jgi:ADP-ribose pyrophosphatase YjhB (NUDIX family)